MKIEKINDNQIRCTLTHADLQDRQLKLSELAYGSEKAKTLFQDMMQQASFEFGFDADNTPLVIEAAPAAKDCIVLTITKITDPEELDEKFSTLPSSEELQKHVVALEKLEGAEHFLELMGGIKKVIEGTHEKTLPKSKHDLGVRLFTFGSLDEVIQVARIFTEIHVGSSSLYKDHDSQGEIYILAITNESEHTSAFSRLCNMMAEYGTPEKVTASTLAFLEEHCTPIISSHALETLTKLCQYSVD